MRNSRGDPQRRDVAVRRAELSWPERQRLHRRERFEIFRRIGLQVDAGCRLNAPPSRCIKASAACPSRPPDLLERSSSRQFCMQ